MISEKIKSKKVGIIGTNWGLMHLSAFRNVGAEIVGLCDKNINKTKYVAQKESIEFVTNDVEELSKECDIVVVAASDSAHFEIIKTLMNQDCHVLCEKPLTRTSDEAFEITNLAEQHENTNKRIFAVNFPYRMMPPMQQLRDWIHTDQKPEQLIINVSNGFAGAYERQYDGPISGTSADFGGVSHFIDAALWIMKSEPAWVQATLIGRPAYSAMFQIGLESGGTIVINHIAALKPGIDCSWRIFSKNFETLLDSVYSKELDSWKIGPAKAYTHDWNEISEYIGPETNNLEPWAWSHDQTARLFLESIDKKTRNPLLASFKDGAIAQQIIDAAIESELTRKRIYM